MVQPLIAEPRCLSSACFPAGCRQPAPALEHDAVAADAIEASTGRVASELQQGGQRGEGPRVGIIMGSDSDLATMKVGL